MLYVVVTLIINIVYEYHALELWLIHSFFTHPLILPTLEKWVGTTSFVQQSDSFRPAKVNEILCKMRSFVQQRYSIRPAIVQQRTTHLFKAGQSTPKTHFLKVG